MGSLKLYKQLLDPILRGAFLLTLLFVTFFSIKMTIGYIYPFLIAFIIAAFLSPLVSYIETKWKLPRTIATLTVIITIFLFFIGIVVVIVNEVIQGTIYLMEKLPVYFHSFIELMETMINDHILPLYQTIASYFESLDETQQTAIQENLVNFLENLANSGTIFFQSILIQIPEVVSKFPGSLTIFIFIVLATFMIVNDWHNITNLLTRLLPTNILSFIYDLQKGIKKAFTGYLRAQFILIFISALIIYIGLLIIGSEHALTIAAIAALVDLLPVIGTGVIFVPWIIYAFLTGDYSNTIPLSILYMTVIITRQFIEPKILSASIGINPLVSLIILFVTIQIWGFGGVLFAPIILITIYVLYQSGIFIKMVQFIKG